MLNSTIGNVAFDNLQVTFSWIDYSLFLLMLSLSVLIGLYFGCCGHQDTADEYLLGGKQMSAIPIGVSLVASNISGITLLGVPTDIYRFGVTYYLYAFWLIPVCMATHYVYIPVFFKLQVVSAYEYLMLRFDRKIRLLASGLYTIHILLYLPIVVYIPALALAQATHISLHYITPLVCSVCIIYTTIGGLKAVVWTDTLQFVVMIGSIVGVFFTGLYFIGGFEELYKRAYDGQRFDFDFDVDPTKRDTVLATSIGLICIGINSSTLNQSFVQKFLSLPTQEDIKKAIILFYIGMFFILTLVLGIALVMYANYYQCDPFSAGKISKPDQVLPFYVMEVATVIPGLAGLFLSGILSAALSTLSACMNSLAASVYEDFVSPFVPETTSQKTISNILKVMVVLIGLISTLMVYVVENMGSIVPINFALQSITNGPLLGLFTLGMLFPVANAKGALFGSLLSFALMTFVVCGNQYHIMNKHIAYETKPVSTSGCNETFTPSTRITDFNDKTNENEVFVLFRLTHYYFAFSGAVITIVVGVLVSYLTRKPTDDKVNPDTISPVVHWLTKRFGQDEKNYQTKSEIEVKEVQTLLTPVQTTKTSNNDL